MLRLRFLQVASTFMGTSSPWTAPVAKSEQLGEAAVDGPLKLDGPPCMFYLYVMLSFDKLSAAM